MNNRILVTTQPEGIGASDTYTMEVGIAHGNIYLQAVSLDRGTVFSEAFDDVGVKAILKLDEAEQPLGWMPVGKH